MHHPGGNGKPEMTSLYCHSTFVGAMGSGFLPAGVPADIDSARNESLDDRLSQLLSVLVCYTFNGVLPTNIEGNIGSL